MPCHGFDSCRKAFVHAWHVGLTNAAAVDHSTPAAAKPLFAGSIPARASGISARSRFRNSLLGDASFRRFLGGSIAAVVGLKRPAHNIPRQLFAT